MTKRSRQPLISVALLAAVAGGTACARESITQLDLVVQLEGALVINQVSLREIIVDGIAFETAQQDFPSQPRTVVSGDVLTLLFPSSEGGKPVSVTAVGLDSDGTVITGEAKAEDTLQAGTTVRAELRFSMIDTTGGTDGGADVAEGADVADIADVSMTVDTPLETNPAPFSCSGPAVKMVDFCDDFDGSDLPMKWTETIILEKSLVTRDTAGIAGLFRSPPNSLVAQVAPQGWGACVRKRFNSPFTEAYYTFDVRIDTWDNQPNAMTNIAVVILGTDPVRPYDFTFGVKGDKVEIHEWIPEQDRPTVTTHMHSIPEVPGKLGWTTVQIAVSLQPSGAAPTSSSLTVRFDGVEVLTDKPLSAHKYVTASDTIDILLGLPYQLPDGQTMGWQAHFDNVTFDLK